MVAEPIFRLFRSEVSRAAGKKKKRKEVEFVWSMEQAGAMEKLKAVLISAPALKPLIYTPEEDVCPPPPAPTTDFPPTTPLSRPSPLLPHLRPPFLGHRHRDRTIMVIDHPNGDVGDEQVQRRNIVHRLVKTLDSKLVTDTSGIDIRFRVLKMLLPPNEISPGLVEFFGHLYNRRTIPGRTVP